MNGSTWSTVYLIRHIVVTRGLFSLFILVYIVVFFHCTMTWFRFRFLALLVVPALSYNYDWQRIHNCTTPAELKATVQDYRENFPCLDCREHFQALLDIHPFPLEYVRTPEDTRVWTWLTHNLVNLRLNKPWESFDIMDECHERL